MQLKRLFQRSAVALMGLALVASMARAADPEPKANPQPKPDDVKKMLAALPGEAPAKPKQPRKLFIYGHAAGFVHGSIRLGAQTLLEMGKKLGTWEGTISYDPADFTAENLKQYDAVALVSTTGMFLGDKDVAEIAKGNKELLVDQSKVSNPIISTRRKALEDFVAGGKGLWGCHAAADAYHVNEQYRYDYDDLIGASFSGHPWGKIHLRLDDPASPLTVMWDKKGFDYSDEIYLFGDKGKNKDGSERQTYSRTKLHILLSADPATIQDPGKGSKREDNDYGYSWIRRYGQGRVFYTGMGHYEAKFYDQTVLKFLLAGMQYAMGDLQADDAPSAKGGAAPAAPAPK